MIFLSLLVQCSLREIKAEFYNFSSKMAHHKNNQYMTQINHHYLRLSFETFSVLFTYTEMHGKYTVHLYCD